MPHLEAPYPPHLSRRRVMLRLALLNQVLVFVGALSMHATEAMDNKLTQILGLPYYLIWMQCIGMTALLLNGSGLLMLSRRGWRQMPDAPERYARLGLYRGLPTAIRWQMVCMSVLSTFASSWLAQQGFIWLIHIIHSPGLPQVEPPYAIALFNTTYGTIAVYVFEYLQDRTALSQMRERMAQKLSDQARLNLLRSQLDPHMLFNTLSNLYELIDESPTQARAMLAHLIGFLRSTLAGSRVTQHSLADEFKLAGDYLALMQIRMGERLQVTLRLPPDLAHMNVPAMLLQPLVENAIKHGLEQRKDGGQLCVSAELFEGNLMLIVSNSGIGDKRDSAMYALTHHQGSGFGLHYVRDRLQALYGDAASIDFSQHHEQNQTLVTLRMPAQPTSYTLTA